MPMQFFQGVWEVAKKYISKGNSNLGPFTWNLTKGNLGINPKIGSSDADQIGIIMSGGDDILLRSSTAEIDVPLAALVIDGNSINDLATIGVSSAISPIRMLMPNINKYIYIALFAKEIYDCLEEDDEEKFGRKLIYVHEVFDYDYYNPIENTYNPPESED